MSNVRKPDVWKIQIRGEETGEQVTHKFSSRVEVILLNILWRWDSLTHLKSRAICHGHGNAFAFQLSVKATRRWSSLSILFVTCQSLFVSYDCDKISVFECADCRKSIYSNWAFKEAMGRRKSTAGNELQNNFLGYISSSPFLQNSILFWS